MPWSRRRLRSDLRLGLAQVEHAGRAARPPLEPTPVERAPACSRAGESDGASARRAVQRAAADLAHHLEGFGPVALKPGIRRRRRGHAGLGQRRIHLTLQFRRRPAGWRPANGALAVPVVVHRPALPRPALRKAHLVLPRSAAWSGIRTRHLVWRGKETKGYLISERAYQRSGSTPAPAPLRRARFLSRSGRLSPVPLLARGILCGGPAGAARIEAQIDHSAMAEPRALAARRSGRECRSIAADRGRPSRASSRRENLTARRPHDFRVGLPDCAFAEPGAGAEAGAGDGIRTHDFN